MNIQTHCEMIAKMMGVNFTVNGNAMPYKDVFSDVGMFPGIVKRAEKLSSMLFDYGLGAEFSEEERSMLGSRVSFNAGEGVPVSLILLCVAEVLYELAKNAKREKGKKVIPLDELIYD